MRLVLSDTEERFEDPGNPIKPFLIRSLHVHAYKSGEWARLIGITRSTNGLCYEVEFIDGTQDYWLINDPSAGYEFQ